MCIQFSLSVLLFSIAVAKKASRASDCAWLWQVYGACFTPGGYPPWTLQYAEMYHMGHLHKTNRMQVRHQFEKYAGTTHRNGS